MKLTALNLTQLKLRLLSAIDANNRACKGSDKTWKRECRQELEEVRGLIINATRKGGQND